MCLAARGGTGTGRGIMRDVFAGIVAIATHMEARSMQMPQECIRHSIHLMEDCCTDAACASTATGQVSQLHRQGA